jgi:hypothetical protein
MKALAAIGLLWAAPFGILGALVMLITGSWPYATRGPAIVCRMSRFLLWFFPRDFNVAAFTWAFFIFTRHDLQDRFSEDPNTWRWHNRLVRHEMEHVYQAMRWGPLFPFLYLGSMAVAAIQGKRAYADCYFEIQANEAEERV